VLLRDAPEGGFLSAQPPQGASAALDEPLALRGRAREEVGPTLRHRQGIRLANASEPQLLHELALFPPAKEQIAIAWAFGLC